jgi:tryptophan-rich sensory protein
MKKLNMKWKYFLTFMLIMLIYYLPSFFIKIDKEYYNNLKGLKLPPIVFIIVWAFLFIFNSIFVTYHIYNKKNHQNTDGSYNRLIVFMVCNYIFSSAFTLLFFNFKNLFLSYLTCLFSFVTMLLALMEASLINKKVSLLLIPNTLWSLFATVLSIIFYLQN